MPSPVIKKDMNRKQLTFSEAIEAILEGRRVTRMEWKNPQEYVFLQGGFLCIHHSGEATYTYHRLLVSDGDMLAKDWLTLVENEYVKN